MDLLFKDVHVFINDAHILHGVCGRVKCGEMLAVMGPSGAGKSTLLTALAGRSEVASGQITLNNQTVTKQTRRKIAYVLQEDVFFPNLTLKETLTFASLLKLPDKMPSYLKKQRVQEILDILKLDKCQNTIMGNASIRGLSGGEKKRATIALELLTNPLVLLLDEPTSGLDYAIAFDLMKIMNDYTKKTNKTVVLTIHQPSSQIYHMFTSLLLLCDGKTAYFGSAAKVLDFFNNVGLYCNPHYNPADFILEELKKTKAITESILELSKKCRKTDWPPELRTEYVAKNQANSSNGILRRLSAVNLDPLGLGSKKNSSKSLQENGKVRSDVVNTTIIEDEPEPEILVEQEATEETRTEFTAKRNSIVETDLQMELFLDRNCKWPTGFWTQFRVLFVRSIKQSRHRVLSKLQIIQSVICTLYASILWFQMDRSEETLRDRMGLLFFSMVYWMFFSMLVALNGFPEERPVINRERAAGMYRLSAYYLAKSISEIPLVVLAPFCYMTIVYFMAGLHYSAANFFIVLINLLFSVVIFQGFGVLVGCAIIDFSRAFTTAVVFVLVAMLAGGYYKRSFDDWSLFLKYISIVNYSYQTFLHSEVKDGDPFKCLPENQTFFESCHHEDSKGQNSTLLVSGQEVAESLDLFPLWLNWLVLVLFSVVTRISGYLCLRFLNKPV